jgi:hypothetical protein
MSERIIRGIRLKIKKGGGKMTEAKIKHNME